MPPIEYAKSGRSRCKKCNRKIGNKSLRVRASSYSGGYGSDPGISNFFLHLRCYKLRGTIGEENIGHRLYGYEKLEEKDQEKVINFVEKHNAQVDKRQSKNKTSKKRKRTRLEENENNDRDDENTENEEPPGKKIRVWQGDEPSNIVELSHDTLFSVALYLGGPATLALASVDQERQEYLYDNDALWKQLAMNEWQVSDDGLVVMVDNIARKLKTEGKRRLASLKRKRKLSNDDQEEKDRLEQMKKKKCGPWSLNQSTDTINQLGMNWREIFGYMWQNACESCRSMTTKSDYYSLIGGRLCTFCRSKPKHGALSRTSAKKLFRLNDSDISTVRTCERQNPYARWAGSMTLCYVGDLYLVAKRKHGDDFQPRPFEHKIYMIK
eukprot:gb/GECH01000648.1/.p1 GENE.gb/GECH01000648.1/~~gb/GECH01000648.1/.p1  ORF type:complete len:381 (+),score=111.41 gb/GECH01000648.1/:1-1143(+)